MTKFGCLQVEVNRYECGFVVYDLEEGYIKGEVSYFSGTSNVVKERALNLVKKLNRE